MVKEGSEIHLIPISTSNSHKHTLAAKSRSYLSVQSANSGAKERRPPTQKKNGLYHVKESAEDPHSMLLVLGIALCAEIQCRMEEICIFQKHSEEMRLATVNIDSFSQETNKKFKMWKEVTAHSAMMRETTFCCPMYSSIEPPHDHTKKCSRIKFNEEYLKCKVLRTYATLPWHGKYWERAEFPFELLPKLANLKVAGGTIQGYGCPGLSIVGSALAMAEIARVDASCCTFMMVHTCLAMLTIAMCGDEDQKQKYLPPLAQLDAISCWALTEPNYGSDASSLSTTATKVDGGWKLDGQKRWIGNSIFADILVVFARNTMTGQINGHVVTSASFRAMTKVLMLHCN
eukprot:Gb_32151 [translate_table: standard]